MDPARPKTFIFIKKTIKLSNFEIEEIIERYKAKLKDLFSIFVATLIEFYCLFSNEGGHFLFPSFFYQLFFVN